jgi:hypothetical protein
VDTGRPVRHNEYGAHHNPALYFTDLRASCAADNLPMGGTGAKDTGAFDKALTHGDVGHLNLIVPNDCENGHDPVAATASGTSTSSWPAKYRGSSPRRCSAATA